MTYRVKSNAVWFNLPGVVAAYQPIAAPDPFAARQNVANGMRRIGSYTAMPGVLPTWSPVAGWTGGGGAYLTTEVTPTSGLWTILVRFTNAGLNEWPLGSYNNATANGYCAIRPYTGGGLLYAWGNDGITVSPSLLSGIAGLTGNKPYRNGAADGGAVAGPWIGTALPFLILARNLITGPNGYFTGSVQDVAIYSRTLTPAEMWLASRQMAYCEQNQDWNAWGRRRYYYYVPAAAGGFQVAWAQRSNTLLGGGM